MACRESEVSGGEKREGARIGKATRGAHARLKVLRKLESTRVAQARMSPSLTKSLRGVLA